MQTESSRSRLPLSARKSLIFRFIRSASIAPKTPQNGRATVRTMERLSPTPKRSLRITGVHVFSPSLTKLSTAMNSPHTANSPISAPFAARFHDPPPAVVASELAACASAKPAFSTVSVS